MVKNFASIFENPSSEYRGKPFWAFNCKLDKDEILRQLKCFKEMGLGGGTIHARTGLDTPYMGAEFMSIVNECIKLAKLMDLKICLYDEDRWPSGFAGGAVTKDEAFRSRYLVFTPTSNKDREHDSDSKYVSSANVQVNGKGKFLAKYDICLDENGCLKEYKLLQGDEVIKGVIWYAYLETSDGNPWFNNQSYVNTLDKTAIEKFIELTHAKYKELFGKEFGKTIPSIFTDEPQFVHKTTLNKPFDKIDIVIPYTDDFEETYQTNYNQSILEKLPEIFWELPDNKISQARYRYHNHVAQRFAEAFSDTVGNWCKDNNIALTGHMMEEPTLASQTQALGEAMRHYRGFDIPGIDMLCDWREYSTAKQAQSAAHQLGGNKVTSELYGVTNWDFDFRGHKLQGDWQAALGVTERVHHLSWASMQGEAKRDYPASISYQSPWHKKYSVIEDYFARVNTLLQKGSPDVKVGVIHPIESYWLHFGPKEQTAAIRENLEKHFEDITQWLLFDLIDFDYISESLMNDLSKLEHNEDTKFSVGKMNYDVVIVPACETLRFTTLKKLKEFTDKGGKVIFMGEFPKYIDGVESRFAKEYAKTCTCINFDKMSILKELEEYRQVDIRDNFGVRTNALIHQIRETQDGKILFVANGKKAKNIDRALFVDATVKVKGEYTVTKFDAMTGKIFKIESEYKNGYTQINQRFYEEDSLLLYLEETAQDETEYTQENIINLPDEPYMWLNDIAEYELSEPNIMMLDQAEYALNSDKFSKKEEVLKIDNILRQKLRYPLKMEALAQPWLNRQTEVTTDELTLRYEVYSDIMLPVLGLALEDAQNCKIYVNGIYYASLPIGYYVDKSISFIKIGGIVQGKNEILIKMPYHKKTNLEWMYLLGDFGVEVYGNKTKLIKKPEEIGFSDLVTQKLPFYAGNITYNVNFEVEKGEYVLQINKYRGALISVKLDGKTVGDIIFSPYLLNLGELEGLHKLEITLYGNRVNAFGPVHLSDEKEEWIGPNSWRTQGDAFSYEYQFKRTGILSAPTLYKIRK